MFTIILQLIHSSNSVIWKIKNIFYDSRKLDESARDILSKLAQPIRVFIPNGPGYGDQVCTLNIIDRLRTLGFNGTIELIGHVNQDSTLPGGLNKALKLLNVPQQLKAGFKRMTLSLPGGDKEFSLMEVSHFLATKSQRPRAPLSIFVGTDEFIANNFPQFFTESPGIFANSERVILYSPFTAIHSYPGFSYQVYGRAIKTDHSSRMLPFKLALPADIDINSFCDSVSLKPQAVCELFKLKARGSIRTHALYGLNPGMHRHPEFTYLNLILAAAQSHDHAKPLVIIAFNEIYPQSWQQLTNYINASSSPQLRNIITALPGKIKFLDPTIDPFPMAMNNSDTYFIRMGDLPRNLFNALFIGSDLPPLYEGANSASLLANANRWGLPCRRPDWTVPNDYFDMPAELQSASLELLCTRNDAALWSNPTSPPERIARLLKSNFTRAPNPLPDRVSYSLNQVFQEPSCEQAPARCAYFQSALRNVLSLQTDVAVKSFGYGVADTLIKQSLFRYTPLKDLGMLNILSALITTTAQMLIEEVEIHEIKLYFMLLLIRQTLLKLGFAENKLLNLPVESALLLSMQLSNMLHADAKTAALFTSVFFMAILFRWAGSKIIASLFNDPAHEEVSTEAPKLKLN